MDLRIVFNGLGKMGPGGLAGRRWAILFGADRVAVGVGYGVFHYLSGVRLHL
jgi:hypothetical protein